MQGIRTALTGAAMIMAGPTVAAAPMTILYHPRSVVELRGHVNVDDFAYTPADPKIKPNQIPNTAIGNIYLSMSVGSFIADGLRQELRTSGVSLQAEARCHLTGTVKAVKIDDLGFDADFLLTAHYTLSGSGGNILYEADEDTAFKAAKFGGAIESISLLFAKNINAMIGSEAFAKAFEPNCPKEG
jgi:hypothetical protein